MVICQGAAGGTFVARVAAADRDSGDAGRVDCRVDTPTTGERRFKLLPVSVAETRAEYRLVTDDGADFDREETDRYHVTVSCVDRGIPPLTTNASLEVLVDDVNDNDPRLSRSHYVFRVAENSRPPAPIGAVAAEDPDLGPSGSVSFHLEPGDADTSESGVIQIDAETGVVTLEAGT